MRTPKWRRIAMATLIPTAILGAAAITVAWAGWNMVRPGRDRRWDSIPRMRFGDLIPVDLFTSDGLRLHAWVLISPIAKWNRWVVLLHGYRSMRTAQHARARFFARRGFHVLLLHFRGHGSSDPARITYGLKERLDVFAACDFIRSIHPGAPVSIGIDGISMGAAAAAYAVGMEGLAPDWMILESCYDNIRHALANRVAMYVGRPLTPLVSWPVGIAVEHLAHMRADDLDPAKALAEARCPILVLAGDSEQVLTVVEIEYLFGAISAPKRLVIFPGAAHEDLLEFEPRRYIREVGRFLREIIPVAGKGPGASGLQNGT